MNDARKQISFYGMKPTKSQQRLVQSQIEKWIAREQSLSIFPKDGSYRVSIEKEPNLPFITCHLRIQIGSRVWESHDTGKVVHEALFHAMHSLRAPWPEELLQMSRFQHAQGVA